MDDNKEKMQKTVSNLQKQLNSLRTNRANPDMLNGIMVDYYGSQVPLVQVAAITVPENMVINLNVFDKSAVKSVEKAIQASSLGINPNTDGNLIRLNLPELTEDRRKDLVKISRKRGEDSKIALRNIRRDVVEAIKQQEKDKEITEDESKKEQQAIQTLTESMNKAIDDILSAKEKEILTI